MNLPDRILTDRPLKCCACDVGIPPGVSAFSICGSVYCERCMWRAKEAAEESLGQYNAAGEFGSVDSRPDASDSPHPQAWLLNGADPEWPEELDL